MAENKRKKWKGNSFQALKELYNGPMPESGVTKPGHEPKGIVTQKKAEESKGRRQNSS
jgi:hypothetical protein